MADKWQTLKHAQHYQSLWKYNLKWQRDTTVHLLECLKLKKLIIPMLVRMWSDWNAHMLLWGCKWWNLFGKQFCRFTSLTHLLYDPITSHLDICSGEMKAYAYAKICKQMLTSDLFVIAKTEKHVTCKCINKLCCSIQLNFL